MVLRTRTIPRACVIYLNGQPVTQRPFWLTEPGIYEVGVYDTSRMRWVGGKKPIVVQNLPQGWGAIIDGNKIGPLERRNRYTYRRVEWEGI